ncbi:MAG: DUF2029 domain-containing protein [Propionibacteriaceae bacterium]|jgi:hypothetical protein|nr:DUF2029 domain-containing protein [Propionibacteriaceae bacterium]
MASATPAGRLLDRIKTTCSPWLVLPSGRRAAAWWVGTRLVMLGLWVVTGLHSQGDVSYYYDNLHALLSGQAGLDQTLPEYPTPLIWILAVPYLLGWGNSIGFHIAFTVLFIATDALMTTVCWRTARRAGTNPGPAAWFWIVFVIAIGPISYMRLDLLTAALSTAAIVALIGRKPGAAGALIATGAAIKLWPALLWPATLVDRRSWRRAGLGFVLAGGGLAAAAWAFAGWDRLVSPLAWQSDRGLQIESVWATPLMLARLFDPGRWTVIHSQYNAFEIVGPGTSALLTASSGATLVGGVVMAVLYIGWLRRREHTVIEAGCLMIIATLIMIVTNKTFSPQYMIWLGGPVVGLLTISARQPPSRPAQSHPAGTPPEAPLTLARRIALWTLVLTVLTQLVYPTVYDWLIDWRHGLTWLATIVLTLRNGLIVYFLVRLVRFAARSVSGRVKIPDQVQDDAGRADRNPGSSPR